MAFIKIIEKIGNAWKKEYEANSVHRDGVNGVAIEFGKVLTCKYSFRDTCPEQELKLKKWDKYYELLLLKRRTLDGQTLAMSPIEREVVFWGCNKKTEEEIYNFVIDYINNAENTEKQKLLIEEFKK